jgi:HPt (histidine-containing phosphotransfer) domain-containing protein
VIFTPDLLIAGTMDDKQLARQVAEGFVQGLSRDVLELQAVVRAGDCQQATHLAHRLKGAAGTMGGQTLQRLAANMEAAGKAQDLSRLKALETRLESEAAALADALRAFIKE